MRTTDPDALFDQHVAFPQHFADQVPARSTGKRQTTHDSGIISRREQVEITVNWETVRREVEKVMNTQFFVDLMRNTVALRGHHSQTSAASNREHVDP